MTALIEIESAIDQLPPEDFAMLRRWFIEKENQMWDAQMDDDSASGRLDFLFDEAAAERTKGELRDW